jgi:hypothetical protein
MIKNMNGGLLLLYNVSHLMKSIKASVGSLHSLKPHAAESLSASFKLKENVNSFSN